MPRAEFDTPHNKQEHVRFKLAFVEQKRCLPSLNRGWRTPDPSPTRVAGRVLPKCALPIEVLQYADRGDVPQPEIDVERFSAFADDTYSECGKCAPPVEALHFADRGGDFGVGFPSNAAGVPQPEIDAERLSAFADDKYFKFGAWASGGQLYELPRSFASSPCLAELSRSRAQVERAYAGERPVQVMSTSMATPFLEEVAEPKEVTSVSGRMSLGSVGHPHTCSEPCKYAWKKNGCKDGENCDRCHFCQWSRSGRRRPTA